MPWERSTAYIGVWCNSLTIHKRYPSVRGVDTTRQAAGTSATAPIILGSSAQHIRSEYLSAPQLPSAAPQLPSAARAAFAILPVDTRHAMVGTYALDPMYIEDQIESYPMVCS